MNLILTDAAAAAAREVSKGNNIYRFDYWQAMEDTVKDISLLRRINLIFRFSYTLPFFMASVCGSLFALLFYDPELYVIILMPVVVLMLAVFVNFSNDYFDHRSGVDEIRFKEKEKMMEAMLMESKLLQKIYWEGNPFDNGLVTEKQGKVIMLILLIIAGALAVPICLYAGWIVLVFGGIGVFISYFYTAPPLDLGARGLGEISVAISFFMLTFCSFVVGTCVFDWSTWSYSVLIVNAEILVFAVIVGTFVGLMRLTDSMSGQEAHIANGERSISVRFGIGGASKIAKVFIVFAYIMAAVMICFSVLYVLLFLTVPLMAKAWKMMTVKSEEWVMRIAPLFFGTAFLTEIMFIIAVIILNLSGIRWPI